MNFIIWKILCRNIQDINFYEKLFALRAKIDESGSSIVCLIETKKEDFDHTFI
jgi:hypothetical protein